ncbi:DUF2254 domain-containing protein [Maritalea mediterranea]|uniref:DUF2254 domain-containing protein n=1 Tax=Maritalea mediterranea TaxID=2909667 RepID=A0ABS9EBJ4_9HYPH|nr:DUF2254 domain-containing protein [Maritalea mediterranea]MCF4098793.1 DUF2254 domain-containing protein [Maritalea mediterranea]
MFVSKFFFLLKQLLSEIWVRLTAFSLLAVMTALAAIALRPFLPESWLWGLSGQSVETILNIIASSMLAVSTFSLGIMANAMTGAAQSTTPRATQLLLGDKTSQNVLTTFLGAFIFALVGIIALHMGVYDEGGRMVLLVTTIIILVIILASFIRWIDLLRVFGRIPDTLDRVEKATLTTLENWQVDPHLGCNPYREGELKTADWTPIHAPNSQFVQHVDLKALNEFAQEHNARILVAAQPGAFACPTMPLAWSSKKLENDEVDKILSRFHLANERTFAQDPELGFIILAETGARALSAAINDPGTAIDCLNRGQRILLQFEPEGFDSPDYEHLWISPVPLEKILKSLFTAIMRDGAEVFEVQATIVRCIEDLLAANKHLFFEPLQPLIRKHIDYIEAGSLLNDEKQDLLARLKKLQ